MAPNLTGVRDDLPTDVVISYGAFEFGPATEFLSWTSTPLWDRAQRTIVAVTHALKLRFWLNSFDANNPQNSLDGDPVNVPFIRQILLQPALPLTLENTGFGTFHINQAGAEVDGALFDVNWGPRPQLLSQKGFYKYGAACEWAVSFQINPCLHYEAVTLLLEWNYALSFSIERGLTTRTYRGHLTMPLTRLTVGDRAIPASVDELWRDQVVPPVPVGFERLSPQTFEVSEDKRTLSFTVVDRQLGVNQYPAGMITVEASHAVRNAKSQNFYQWQHTLRARYQIDNRRQHFEAWNHFLQLYFDRTAPAVANGQLVLPLEWHLEDPAIYGTTKTAAFTFTYLVMPPKAQRPKDAKGKLLKSNNYIPRWVIQASGLWLPTHWGDTWQAWAASMATVQSPWGYAHLSFAAADDQITDPCGGGIPTSVKAALSTKPYQIKVAGFSQEIDPANSYLDYQLHLDVQTIDNTVLLQPLPVAAIDYAPQDQSTSATGGYVQPYGASTPASLVQYRGAPRYLATLWGRATRAAFDIVPPQLVQLGGQTPVPCNDEHCGFRGWVDGNLLTPLVHAEWLFRYWLPQAPTQAFVAPSNPLSGGTQADKQETRVLKGGVAKG